MSDIKLSLELRTLTGKKLASLRADGKIPSVIYGKGLEPVLAQSDYNATEQVLRTAGYHSTIDLEVNGKKQLALVKNVDVDPVSRQIVNVEFQGVSADQAVEATTPIVLVGFEESEANKLHFALTQSMEEVDVKAKPSDLPKELTINVSGLATINDKVTVADIVLPQGVEFSNKELDSEQVVASLYDPAAEAAAREAEEAAAKEAEVTDAADVPSDNGSKPEAPEAEVKPEEKSE